MRAFCLIFPKERAINITGSKNKIALHTLLQEVLPKLADNRVVVRQECLYLAAEIATVKDFSQRLPS